MSILAISAQVFAKASLGVEAPREFFTPPPKVDSQAVILTARETPLVSEDQQRDFFRLVKAGFAEKRKKLRSSLSGGFHISKDAVDTWLESASISKEARAQELSIEDWLQLLAMQPK